MTALAGLALLTACSGSSNPRVLPTLTLTPSASSAPVVVPPTARAHTAFGAAAFVRFYYEQVNKAYQAADAGLLAGLSDPACSTCAAFIKAVKDLAAKQEHLVGTAVRILSAEAPPEQGGIVAVDVEADAPTRTLVKADGTVIQRGEPDPAYHLTVYVRHIDAGWLVRAVKRT